MRRAAPVAVFLAVALAIACGGKPPTPASAVIPGDLQAARPWYFWTDDGVRHFVTELGRGPEVVVLHGGWGAEHSYLLDLIRPLGDRFRFVLYDQRGSLRSPAPGESLFLSRLVADLEKLRKESGHDRLTLLTHSMGSQLACAYLKEHPERVRSMVMLSPVIPDGAAPDDELVAQAHARFVAFAQANEARQVEKEGLDGRAWESLTDREKSARNQISLASGNLYHMDRWRQLEGGQVFYDSEVWWSLRRNSPPDDWQGLFDALEAHGKPLFLIMGDHDLVDFGLETWPRLLEALPDAELTTIDQAGHNSWIDQPAAVQAAVARSLSDATERE